MLTRKSESNWLNRLRSAKGFPADHHLNLDHFLNLHTKLSHTPNDSIPNSPSRNPCPNRTQLPAIQPENGAGGLFNVMSNVLAELFVMGDSRNFPKKKGFRKQPNPRNLHPENVKLLMSCNDEREQVVNCGEVDDEDLSAFSRTEVTVIDTSYESWKFEKMLFRKKNVWKVRDRKCKGVINVGRTKRKGSSLLSEDEKKVKFSSWECSSSNLPLNDGLHRNDRIEEVCKQGADTLNQISKTRLPRKLKKIGSSAILGKGILTPKKISRSNEKCLL